MSKTRSYLSPTLVNRVLGSGVFIPSPGGTWTTLSAFPTPTLLPSRSLNLRKYKGEFREHSSHVPSSNKEVKSGKSNTS